MTATLTRGLTCTVDQAAFKTAAGAAAKRVPSRPTEPTLACIRLDVTGDRMTIQAFDGQVSLSASLDVDGEADGSVLVSGRLLASLVDTLPAKPVQLTVEDGRLKLSCGTVKLTFPTLPVDEYPALPALPPTVGTIDAATLSRAAKRVAVATGPDANPPAFAGMWLQFGDDLQLAASDKYRAAGCAVPWRRTGGHVPDAVVAAHVLAEVVPMLAGEVTVHADGNLFGLSCGDVTVVAGQIAEGHPKALILKFFEPVGEHIATVEAAEFVAHLSRANKVHDEKSAVVLSFDGVGVTVGAVGVDATDATAVMDCHLVGDPIEVHINPAYLIDAVRAADAVQVMLSFVAPIKPFQVSPADAGDPYRHVIVPIRPGAAQ